MTTLINSDYEKCFSKIHFQKIEKYFSAAEPSLFFSDFQLCLIWEWLRKKKEKREGEIVLALFKYILNFSEIFKWKNNVF